MKLPLVRLLDRPAVLLACGGLCAAGAPLAIGRGGRRDACGLRARRRLRAGSCAAVGNDQASARDDRPVNPEYWICKTCKRWTFKCICGLKPPKE